MGEYGTVWKGIRGRERKGWDGGRGDGKIGEGRGGEVELDSGEGSGGEEKPGVYMGEWCRWRRW